MKNLKIEISSRPWVDVSEKLKNDADVAERVHNVYGLVWSQIRQIPSCILGVLVDEES